MELKKLESGRERFIEQQLKQLAPPQNIATAEAKPPADEKSATEKPTTSDATTVAEPANKKNKNKPAEKPKAKK